MSLSSDLVFLLHLEYLFVFDSMPLLAKTNSGFIFSDLHFFIFLKFLKIIGALNTKTPTNLSDEKNHVKTYYCELYFKAI